MTHKDTLQLMIITTTAIEQKSLKKTKNLLIKINIDLTKLFN